MASEDVPSHHVVAIDGPVTIPISQQDPGSLLGIFLSSIMFRLWDWLAPYIP